MIPNQSDLEAALRKVRANFGSLGPVKLKYFQGRKPVIVIEGGSAVRPVNLPKFIRSFADARMYPIPILWHAPGLARAAMPLPRVTPQEDILLNDAMWAGAPAVSDKPIKMWSPADTIEVPIQQAPPAADEKEYEFATPVRLPQFNTPNFWAKPFHDYSNLCCPYYQRRTLAYSYKVPSDYLLIINGMSYEFSDLVLFDQFIIHMLRDGNQLTEWRDMKATNDPDPARQFVFAGHFRPFPVWARFDHDQTFGVAVTVLGPYPFTTSRDDTLGGCVSIYPRGWLGSLYDNRDGGARPVDMGELNDIFLGEPSDA